eukprot:1017358-Pyramimonas_sp.AAC.1
MDARRAGWATAPAIPPAIHRAATSTTATARDTKGRRRARQPTGAAAHGVQKCPKIRHPSQSKGVASAVLARGLATIRAMQHA